MTDQIRGLPEWAPYADEDRDMSDAKNIYQRLNAVREAVKYLQKDKEVQGYRAVTHDAVTAATREELIKHGVLIVPRQISSHTSDVGQTKGGATIIRYEAWYEIDFVNIDQPDDKVIVPIEAHANDQGDKAPGKAVSYATKYAILKLLSIETGESEESRVEIHHKAQPITAQQLEELRAKMEATGTEEDKFLGYLNKQPNTHIDALSDLRTGVYEFAMKALDAKAKKASSHATAE